MEPVGSLLCSQEPTTNPELVTKVTQVLGTILELREENVMFYII
jgi:hypothetical protein